MNTFCKFDTSLLNYVKKILAKKQSYPFAINNHKAKVKTITTFRLTGENNTHFSHKKNNIRPGFV